MPDTVEPPKLDARGVVIVSEEVQAELDRRGIIATEPAGSVKPCMFASHEDRWWRRPWPMGDMSCDICHPSLETLERERLEGKRTNLAPARTVGRHIAPPRPKWETASSDLAGQVDSKTVLFGDDV